MKRKLLEILCCPLCRGALKVFEFSGTDDDTFDQGHLRCSICKALYPVVSGIPRMVVQDGLIPDTRKGFEYQWTQRQSGRAEKRETIYGYDIGKFMKWLTSTFTKELQLPSSGAWLLDAGCGSAEKARELALAFPRHEIVALDQSGSLIISARQNEDVANLHFIEANILHPPFSAHAFAFVMSIGVLHHTPDTQRAFSAIAPLVQEGGGFLTWIYPLPQEDAFWAGLYHQRDRHFLKIGHRLPRFLTMLLCHLYIAVLFPFVLHFLKQQHRTNTNRFPIYPDQPSLQELYKSSVFLSFDNVMPKYQFRHGRAEVGAWYRTHGFVDINDLYPGFYYAVLK